MPSTTMNRISEFFFPFVHHPISTRHFDSCQLVPGGFYPPNPLRKLWCWEKYGGRKDYTFSQSFEEDTVFENYIYKKVSITTSNFFLNFRAKNQNNDMIETMQSW